MMSGCKRVTRYNVTISCSGLTKERYECVGTALSQEGLLRHSLSSAACTHQMNVVAQLLVQTKTEQTWPDLVCSCLGCTAQRKPVLGWQCFSVFTENPQISWFLSFWKDLSLKMHFWREVQEFPCSPCTWAMVELKVMGMKPRAVEAICRPMSVMKYVYDQVLTLGLSVVLHGSFCPGCKVMVTNNRLQKL